MDEDMSETEERMADKEYMDASFRMSVAVTTAREIDLARADGALHAITIKCGDVRGFLGKPFSVTREARMAYIKDITEAMEAITGPSEVF